MTLTAVSNTALTQSHTSHQKTETDTGQPQKGNPNPTSEKDLSGKIFDDNVTLSQSEKNNDPSKVIDKKVAETRLPQIIKSILTHSKAAISAQANTTPQAARELLS